MNKDSAFAYRFLSVFGIVANSEKEKALEIAGDLCKLLDSKNLRFNLDEYTADKISIKSTASSDEIDCLVVIGGDGTILSCSNYAAEKKVPLLGVNLGRLGFLSEIEPGDLPRAIDLMTKGRYSLETRSMLNGKFTCSNNNFEFDALNDFFMYKEHPSKTVRISAHVDNRVVSDFTCDGIVVSTTTGSSAYSLSAGGPLIAPDVEAIMITPIAPHALNARPMVFNSSVTIELVLEDDRDNSACICGDGNILCSDLRTGAEFKIVKSEKEIQFLKISEEHYFDLIKRKLNA